MTKAERAEAESKVAQFPDLRSKEEILDVAGKIGSWRRLGRRRRR